MRFSIETSNYGRSSAIADTARVTMRSVIGTAIDRITLTVILNMTYANFIPLIELSIRAILHQVASANAQLIPIRAEI